MLHNKKLNLFIGILLFLVISMFLFLYLYLLPKAVSSKIVQGIIKDEFYKLTKTYLIIDNPILRTSLSPNIEFSIDKFAIIKEKDFLLDLNKCDVILSFNQLFNKRVDLRQLSFDNLYVNADKLIAILPQSEKKEEKSSDWTFSFLESNIDIKSIKIVYNANDVLYDVSLKDLSLSKLDKKNYFHFLTNILVTKGDHTIKVSVADEHKVYVENKKLFIDNCNLHLNESVVNLCASMDKKNRYNVKVLSKGFKVENVIDIVESNILIPNGAELLGYFSDIKGSFDFDLFLDNNSQGGTIDIKEISLGLLPVDNIPVKVTDGKIKLTSNDIFLSDFVGYYEKHKKNTLLMSGSIKDYMKTFDTNLEIKANVTNDFMRNYLSKMIGYSVELVGDADTKLKVSMKNNVVDLRWYFWINPDDDILVGGEPLSKYKLQRILVADMQIKDLMLDIKNLDYYVTLPNQAEKVYKKILQLTGKIDFSKDINFKEMGFDISEPLPSEFLNMVARADLFKGGTVVGKLKAIDGPKGVKLFGHVDLSKIRVPSQRIYLEKAKLSTNFNTINISANGRYRRTKYNLDGEFVNNIAFPIIINEMNLAIDKINIGKMMQSMNMQGQVSDKKADLSDDDDITPTFDVSNLIIKNSTFKMTKGIYNELSIDNLLATMTLNENAVLELKSNKFGFAEGFSSCKVLCDLKNHIYKVRLGVKDVNSNLVATSLLGIKDEISGTARGLIDLHTDDSLKLNGDIKFEIKDGTIGTVGFLQYALNVASIFRNPLAMISPLTIWDLVNIPKGEFKNISGILSMKNNVIEQIKITSSAPQLSSYITGSFDLDKRDASLRIYTKFSNKNTGVYGFLRKLSLSAIATRLPLSNKTLYNFYSAEVNEIPKIDADEKDCQVYLTKVEGDVEHNNFISSLRRVK